MAKVSDADESALNEAMKLLESCDHEGAASLAQDVLNGFNRDMLSRAALIRGKALLTPLLAQITDGEKEKDMPGKEAFREPWTMLMLSRSLNPENPESKSELDKLNGLLQHFSSQVDPDTASSSKCKHHHQHGDDSSVQYSYAIQELNELQYDVVVVGAGASGVGMGIMLTKVFDLDPERVLLVERGTAVGETFRRWPEEMRFISPSFNHQGWTKSFDLNSVVSTSKAARREVLLEADAVMR